jgi:hypothetical protein
MMARDSIRSSNVVRSAREAPLRVVVAAAIWLVFAALELLLGAGGLLAGGSSESSGASAAVSGQLGDGTQADPSSGFNPTTLIPIAVGVALIVLAVLLVKRTAWARLGLELVGTIAVIELAIRAQTLAFVAMALLVLATLPTMSRVTHRYIYGHTTPADGPDTR